MKKTKTFYICLIVAVCLGCAARLYADSATPTDSTQAIMQHPGFREGLVWTGIVPPTESDSAALLQIIQHLDQPNWPANVEQYLRANPMSPWAASLHHAYASFCHRTGRTSKALEHWEAGWALVQNDTSDAGRKVGGKILANWTEQLSSLGRRDKLAELIPAADQWAFVNPQDREKYQAAKANYYLMGNHPEISFRCGTLALKAVGQVLQPNNQALDGLVDIPSPTNGFTVAALTNFAEQYKLPLVAVRRTRGQQLIVPSVIHWRQNHYAAILSQTNGLYLVNDPTFGKPKWMLADAINEEASGIFLIPASALTPDWQMLGPDELASTHGMGLPNNVNDAKDKGCSRDFSGNQVCRHCPGMPEWWVSEPYVNLWIKDEPLSYLTSRGEPFTFGISYKQRDTRPTDVNDPVTGWNNSWVSFVEVDSDVPCACFIPNFSQSDAILYLPEGGAVFFPEGQRYDQETRLLLQLAIPSDALAAGWHDSDGGLRVIHADGAQDIYGFVVQASPVYGDYPVAYCELTRRIDPHGNQTSLQYESSSGQYIVQYVVDYDGRTNSLGYTFNSMLGNLVTSVTNVYGQSAHFLYDTKGNLTNMTDAAGLSSSLTYDTNGYPTSLITPYGTNLFYLYVNSTVATTNGGEGNFGGDDLVDRAVRATDPTGGNHLYLYRYDCSQFMSTTYSSSAVPTNTPIGTLDAGTGGTNSLDGVDYRNSFSWDARQCLNLSITNFDPTNLAVLSSTDFLRGRMKHWLQDTNDLSLSGYISTEREPSPDGTTTGLMSFYDYQGKTYPHRAGTNALPSVKAWRLPNGETHYEYVQFDYFGNITNRATTYTTTSGALSTRTDQFVFSNNTYTNVPGVTDGAGNILDTVTNTFTVPDLLTKKVLANGSNTWSSGTFDTVAWTNYFNIEVQTNETIEISERVMPDKETNGVGYVTTRTYAGFDRVTGVQWPSGLVRTNFYDTNNFLIQAIDEQINRTNNFGYSNGLISAYTNEVGLRASFNWDNLLRLTGIGFSDGTTVSNIYNRLDLGASKDRIGYWTYFGYDGLRHLTSVTNANNGVTSYGWCDCGSLTTVTDALSNVTSLGYDQAERLTSITFPDTSSLTYEYDLAGEATNVVDGTGNNVEFTYNNQGLVSIASNLYGAVWQVAYDTADRPTVITNAEGVVVTDNYDFINRLLVRIWPDGTNEGFGYATNGLTAYTNRDSEITRWGRDAGSRTISITNGYGSASQRVNGFGYDARNHITSLTDGLSHATTWHFNQFGWLTNKVDANSNPEFVFAYDSDGHVTNRWMPVTTNTSYAYDAVGNLTNISYPGAANPTAAISYQYDADNRLTNMVDGVGTSVFGYTASSQLASERSPFSTSGDTVSYLYDQGYRTNLALTQPSGTWQQSYFYDFAWRLQNLISPAGIFNYGYQNSASALVQNLNLPNGANITNQYDSLARLSSTALVNHWGHVLDGDNYGYDGLGLRTSITRNYGLGSNTVTAAYDALSQLTSWTAKESSGTSRLNEQLGYGYDNGGNLNLRTNGALVQTFSVNSLNELSTVSRTGTLTVSGNTPAPAVSVTVNGATAQTNGDLTFAANNNTLVNGNNSFTNIAQNVYGVKATNTFTVNLLTNVSFTYDNNGNLMSDGTRSFLYDGESQLTNVNVANAWKTEFAYDGLKRRRIERDYTWQSGAWSKTNEMRFIYDGMLLLQERDTNNNPLVTYTRGLDLSRSRQGAGGIGGLLARTDTNSIYYHADGLGNISALMDGDENIVQRSLYDPFGRILGQWGVSANIIRSSSMSLYRNSNLVGYWGRFYDPTLQRWLNRDPIGERGGINLYGFVGNNPIRFVDPFGMQGVEGGEGGDPVPEGAKTEQEQFQDAVNNDQVFGAEPDPDALYEQALQEAQQKEAEQDAQAAQTLRTPDSSGSEGDNAPPSSITRPIPKTPCPPGYKPNWQFKPPPYNPSKPPRFFNPEGEEFRRHDDPDHVPHWDYRPWPSGPWLNMDDNGQLYLPNPIGAYNPPSK